MESITRVPLNGSIYPRRNGTVAVGPARADEKYDLSVVARNADALDQVQRFARQQGLSVGSVDETTHTVKLGGTTADYERAFGVHLAEYQDPAGHRWRGYEGALSLPPPLAAGVQGIFGLDNRSLSSPLFRVANKRDDAAGFPPPHMAQYYHFPQNTDGTGQTIAILELGGGYRDDDLKAYFQKLGLSLPKVTSISIDGAQNAPSGPRSDDREVAMDVEVAGAAAPGANMAVYFAPRTEQGYVDAIHQAVHDKQRILSISWGIAESDWSPQALASINQALQDARAAGMNVFVAAGDDGSTNGEDDKQNHVIFPASSPSVIACGGTQFNAPDGQFANETAWNDRYGATGGGVSDVFAEPSWQPAAQVPKPTTPGGGRGLPDIAAYASPETGYLALVDGQWTSIGGTSAVAPLMAGLAARLAQGLGTPLPDLAPFLYHHPEAFRDITTGSNGGYQAGPGWDPVTGLGVPDGEKLLTALKAGR